MDLEECVLITDTTLIHLALGCPRLENLVCTGMDVPSKRSIIEIVCHLVNGCSSVVEFIPLRADYR